MPAAPTEATEAPTEALRSLTVSAEDVGSAEPPVVDVPTPLIARHEGVLRAIVEALHQRTLSADALALAQTSSQMRALVGAMRSALEEQALQGACLRLGTTATELRSKAVLDWPMRFMAESDWSGLCLLLASPSAPHAPRELCLTRNAMHSEVAHTALQLFCMATLQRLDLSWCQLGPSGAAALAEPLATATELRNLHLYRNGIGDVGLTALVDALEKLGKLEELYLGHNDICSDSLAALTSRWEENPETEFAVLNSRGNPTEVGRAKLAKTQLRLQRLDLSGNRIGNEGLAALGQCMRSSLRNLRMLALSGNRIGGEGAMERLLVELSAMSLLEAIHLESNPLTDDDLLAVAAALEAEGHICEQLRRLDVRWAKGATGDGWNRGATGDGVGHARLTRTAVALWRAGKGINVTV